MLRLYDFGQSGNCHKVRLMLSMLRLTFETVTVDMLAAEHRSREYLEINPLGQVPALRDRDLVLRDSQAILIYLARRYGGESWLPDDPKNMARVVQWLFTAANEIQHGPAAARLAVRFGVGIDLTAAQGIARKILAVLDSDLAGHDWLALDRPTIADLACYPYVALAPEGDVPLAPFPAVCAWIRRIEALPGYLGMPGLPREFDRPALRPDGAGGG
ncbi:MAG: glutathione S-transferase family protein [Rhodospirillales bacterium]